MSKINHLGLDVMSILKKMLLLILIVSQLGWLTKEGEPPKYTLEIIGLQDKLLKNATSQLRVFETNQSVLRANQKPSPSTLHTIEEEVKKAIEPYGYFKASVKAVAMQDKNGQWKIAIYVEKGEPLRVKSIDLRLIGAGQGNLAIIAFMATFPIAQNSIFEADSYENAKAKFFQTANNEGYIRAFYEKSAVLIDLKKYHATIILHLKTGSRYYFGSTTFNQHVYSPDFLHRFLNYQQGEPFSNQKILLLEQKMAASSYFKQVTMMPDFDNIDHADIPIKVSTTPPKSRRYAIGFGYGTFTGPRLTASGNFRRLTNTGQHLDVQLRLSSVLSGVSGKYFIPGSNPLTDNWIIGANHEQFAPANGNSVSNSAYAGYNKKLEHFQFSTNINYLTEHYNEDDLPSRTSSFLYPNATFAYTEMDDLLTPRFGKYFSLMLQGTSKELISTTRFFQTTLKAKYITSPISVARIIARGEFGYTVVHDLLELPLTMRYFAGGLSTIRGYPESSIGPGKYLQVGSLEYQHRIVGNWSGAVFYDLGIASNHFGDKLNEGTGVGIIYNSVIGNLKVYVARAISKPNKPYNVEFSFGPDF